jgi:hypothetical protein
MNAHVAKALATANGKPWSKLTDFERACRAIWGAPSPGVEANRTRKELEGFAFAIEADKRAARECKLYGLHEASEYARAEVNRKTSAYAAQHAAVEAFFGNYGPVEALFAKPSKEC